MKPIIFQYDGNTATALQRLQEAGATDVVELAQGFISAKIDEGQIPFLDQYGRVEIKPLKQTRQ